MTGVLAFLLGSPTILAIGAAIIGALGFGFKQRLAGVKAERAKQATAEAVARDIADQVQNDIGALPADQARRELKSWARD
ncbi:ABC transporter permease [Mesorhizobium sp.]|uniref:ABC transporter permease n=1 Tax=Mesorhizobium sp. TaxID=1871066 RepID=UPI003BAB3AA4